MEALQQLGAALGLGFLSGIRLYLTVLALGLSVRYQLITLTETFRGLEVLADWRVIGVAAAAALIEFLADKIPWLDSAWDSLHTFIRPVGAVLLGATAFAHTDAVTRVILMILCGGVALSGHSAKAATRLAVNHSPEPFSNVALSVAGDLVVPAATWFTFQYPLVMAGFVVLFLVLFLWLSPKVYRSLRAQLATLGSALVNWLGGEDAGGAAAMPASLPKELGAAMRPLPDWARELARKKLDVDVDQGVRVIDGRGAYGPRNQLGYLVLEGDRLAFLSKRLIGGRAETLPLPLLQDVTWRSRWFVDELRFREGDQRRSFDVLRAAPRPAPLTAQSAERN
jgi:hypothetical protein